MTGDFAQPGFGNRKFRNCLKSINRKEEKMLNYLVGTVETGDASKPWLIAICMIVSIIVVVALFIMGNKNGDDAASKEDEMDGFL